MSSCCWAIAWILGLAHGSSAIAASIQNDPRPAQRAEHVAVDRVDEHAQRRLDITTPKPAIEIQPSALDKLEESKCFACHSDIAREWSTTAHALAWLDTDYQEALADKSKPETCYGCHIPSSLVDSDLKSKPTPRENDRRFGVSCESCHVDATGVVHGPRGTPTDAHATRLDARLVAPGSNELCASCHRTNIGPVVGIAVDFETAKMAERGSSCVGCHLQSVETRFADGDATPRRSGRSHALQTPRDPAFLKLAFELKARVESGQTIVTVSNRAGHRVPGLIGRSITFEVEALDASGAKCGASSVSIDAANYLPVDGEIEIAVPAVANRVHVVGEHLDPRATDAIAFLATDFDLAASEARPEHVEPVREEKGWIHGWLTSRYRGRWASGANDHDLITTLGLDIGRTDAAGWSGAIVVDALADLDGHEGDGSPFAALDDTHTEAVQLRVYEAHADYRAEVGGSFARFGRQSDADTPVQLWYDGVRIENRVEGRRDVRIGLYGGRPVRFYDSDEHGDADLGAYVSAKPWRGSEVRVDALHLEDEPLLGSRANDLVAVGARQSIGESLRVAGTASWLDGEDRDASARAVWNDTRDDLVVEVRGYQLFRAQNRLAPEIDPFTNVLLEEAPYREGRVLVSKGLGSHLRLEGGYDKRELEFDSDEGTFNHGFERIFAGATLVDVLPLGVGLSATGERWNSSTNDIDTWSADLSKELAPRVDLSIGSSYALYATDIVSVTERSDVRAWYARLRSRPRDGLSWDLRYEYDDTSDLDTNTIRVGATWQF